MKERTAYELLARYLTELKRYTPHDVVKDEIDEVLEQAREIIGTDSTD